jgi:hypothetical protein
MVVLPFHTLRILVAVQMAMGAFTAGLMGLMLMRDCGVRYSLALSAALLLAWDPTQVVHEHLVMTETCAMLAGAIFLFCALKYLVEPCLAHAAAIGLAGFVAVGFRLVYIPVVWAAAILLPFLATRYRWRTMLLATTVIISGQLVYQYLTGYLLAREPAYHYRTGSFLLANVSAIVHPEDATDPRAADIIRRLRHDPVHPLSDRAPDNRNFQLWSEGGLIQQLEAYVGDRRAAEKEARWIAMTAIRRDPLGFLGLGVASLAAISDRLDASFPYVVAIENGSSTLVQPAAADWIMLASRFDSPNQRDVMEVTPSRRYHLYGRPWVWLQLLSPLIGLCAWLAAPVEHRWSMGSIAGWSTVILAVTCLTTPVAVRYLHPLSLPAFAALAVLAEALLRRRARRIA